MVFSFCFDYIVNFSFFELCKMIRFRFNELLVWCTKSWSFLKHFSVRYGKMVDGVLFDEGYLGIVLES